jgi:GNAT superfamily N-acetyltransferase
MEYAIIEATEGDAETLAHIIRQAFTTVALWFGLTQENAPRHPSNCTSEWVREGFAKGIRYFLLTTPEGPAGCIALERSNDDVYYLERLAVLPGQQRRGLGEALVNSAVDRARELGAKRVELGMVAAQAELRRWYEKLGFKMRDIVQFEGAPFEVGFMTRTISQGNMRGKRKTSK